MGELTRRGTPGHYGLRATDRRVVVRHATRDVAMLADIFSRRCYEPPPQARAALGAGSVRVLDLGANIGLFGVLAASWFPELTMVSVEPDPANLAVLRRCVAANALADRWQVVAACAGTRAGTAHLQAGRFSESRIDGTGEGTEVAMVDVFGLVEGVTLLKIDIEGSEWPILADPRLATLPAAVVVMEWHAAGCPHDDPEAAAVRALEGAGYRVQRWGASAANGTVWAWRR